MTAADVPDHLRSAFAHSQRAGYRFARALVESAPDSESFAAEADALFDATQRLGGTERREVLRGVVDGGGRAGGLFVVQRISGLRRRDARAWMKDYLDSGGGASDVAAWLQLAGDVLRRHNVKRGGTAGAVVDAVGDAAEWVVDALEDGVDALLEGIDAVIDAVTSAGAAIVDLFEEVAAWTAAQIGDLLRALVEAGVAIGEFVGATFDWTYRAVSTFVEAAFDVGFAIADLLENVVSESYWVLRRFVNGIIENLGPVGEVLDFVLTQIEDAADALWRDTLLALRFAEARLLDVLDWMATQTQDVVNAVIAAWESIGEDLIEIYEWALTAGAAVWAAIGEATATIGNSIWYAYNFLATSGVEFLFDYTRGLLRAGRAIGEFLAWSLERSLEVAREIVRAAFDVGVTIGTMLVDIATEPRAALRTLLQAIADVGRTLEDVLEAAIIETAEEFLDEVVDALVEIGNAIVDLCVAGLRVSGAALAVLIAALVNRLGSFRPLTDAEEADARTAFGSALDYENVFLSTEDPLNEIIFGVQDFFTGNPDSRAFVTMNLVNFDVDDGQIDRVTLIHELTHVWQAREVGGIYMAEAIGAQMGDGYNYGYRANDGFILGASDGSNAVFGTTLDLPVTPATIQLVSTDGDGDETILALDDGAGAFTDEDGTAVTGAIDYATGTFSITLPSAPNDGGDVLVLHRVTMNAASGGGEILVHEGSELGVGGEPALEDADGDFDAFNREQQGQVIQQWFARTQLTATDNNGDVVEYDATAWQRYRDFVASA